MTDEPANNTLKFPDIYRRRAEVAVEEERTPPSREDIDAALKKDLADGDKITLPIYSMDGASLAKRAYEKGITYNAVTSAMASALSNETHLLVNYVAQILYAETARDANAERVRLFNDKSSFGRSVLDEIIQLRRAEAGCKDDLRSAYSTLGIGGAVAEKRFQDIKIIAEQYAKAKYREFVKDGISLF